VFPEITNENKSARARMASNPGRLSTAETASWSTNPSSVAMDALQRGMKAHGIRVRRKHSVVDQEEGEALRVAGSVERGVAIELPAPGQRGMTQILLQGGRDLATIRPSLTKVHEGSSLIEKRRKKREKLQTKVHKQVRALIAYVEEKMAKLNEAEMELCAAEERAEEDPEALDQARKWARPVNLIKVLARVNAGLRHVEKARGVEIRSANKDRMLDEVVFDRANELAGELQQHKEHQIKMGSAFMRTKYNKDAATAVGRGPPGHIAFSIFTAHDPLFERSDVVQVIMDASRRSGAAGGGGSGAAARSAAPVAGAPS
jgi:hypothetical protein